MRCDCHVHIVGPHARYAQVPQRTYLAGVARLDDLKRLGATSDVARFVIVQPSFYGTDNSLLLDSLDALGGRGRGVAVIDPGAAGQGALDDMHARGVRGLRINLYSQLGGPSRLDGAFAAQVAVAQRMGWHVELIAPIAMLADNAGVIAAAPVPIVIDHYGVYGEARPDDAHGRALLGLLARDHVWMKLSAPYRVSPNPLQTRPDPQWLAAILDAAADRSVWGSDWPWTAGHDQHKGADVIAPYRALSYPAVLDDFLAALPDTSLADRLLIDNPSRLYEFYRA